jgi:hypothetical protein
MARGFAFPARKPLPKMSDQKGPEMTRAQKKVFKKQHRKKSRQYLKKEIEL